MKKLIKLLACIVFVLLAVANTSCVKKHYDIITDTDRYNELLSKHDYFSHFPKELPGNAEVVEFRFIDHDIYQREVYLEFKFQSSGELITYVNALKQDIGENNIGERQNPNRNGYTDLYRVSNGGYSDAKGRSFWYHSDQYVIRAHYQVYSFSEENCTMIITVIDLDSVSNQNYTPRYFEKFNIPRNGAEYEVSFKE